MKFRIFWRNERCLKRIALRRNVLLATRTRYHKIRDQCPGGKLNKEVSVPLKACVLPSDIVENHEIENTIDIFLTGPSAKIQVSEKLLFSLRSIFWVKKMCVFEDSTQIGSSDRMARLLPFCSRLGFWPLGLCENYRWNYFSEEGTLCHPVSTDSYLFNLTLAKMWIKHVLLNDGRRAVPLHVFTSNFKGWFFFRFSLVLYAEPLIILKSS